MAGHAFIIFVEVPITVDSFNARNRKWSHFARIAVALAVVRFIRGTIIIRTIIVNIIIAACCSPAQEVPPLVVKTVHFICSTIGFAAYVTLLMIVGMLFSAIALLHAWGDDVDVVVV